MCVRSAEAAKMSKKAKQKLQKTEGSVPANVRCCGFICDMISLTLHSQKDVSTKPTCTGNHALKQPSQYDLEAVAIDHCSKGQECDPEILQNPQEAEALGQLLVTFFFHFFLPKSTVLRRERAMQSPVALTFPQCKIWAPRS